MAQADPKQEGGLACPAAAAADPFAPQPEAARSPRGWFGKRVVLPVTSPDSGGRQGSVSSLSRRRSFTNPAAADSEAAQKVRRNISEGRRLSQRELIEAGAVRRMSGGRFNVLHDVDVEAAVADIVPGEGDELTALAEGCTSPLRLAFNESISLRIMEFHEQRERFAQQMAKQKGMPREEALAAFRADHGLLRGNEATIEALRVEKAIGHAGREALALLEVNTQRIQDMTKRLSELPSATQWPESEYTLDNLCEQCGLLEHPARVDERIPAMWPRVTPMDARAEATAQGLTTGPSVGARWGELAACWDTLRDLGCVYEAAQFCPLPIGGLGLIQRAQDYSGGGIDREWEPHSARVGDAEAAAREVRHKLVHLLSKEQERDARKRRRDQAEDAVQAAAAHDKLTPEERNWAWRYRRRKEREVPYVLGSGKAAENQYRRLASVLDGVGEVSRDGWNLLERVSGHLSAIRADYRDTQKKTRDTINEARPVIRQKINNLEHDLKAVQDTFEKAKEVNRVTEQRLEEMHRGSEELLAENAARQAALIAELRHLVEERDAEVHRRIEEIHKENKRKKEFGQFTEVAIAHLKRVEDAITRQTTVENWVAAVNAACEACWPEVEKQLQLGVQRVTDYRIASQERLLAALHSACQCRHDQARHKLRRADDIERALVGSYEQAAFCRQTWDPNAKEHEDNVAELWGVLRTEGQQLLRLRDEIIGAQPVFAAEELRLRKVPGGAARRLPAYPFDRDKQLREDECHRWQELGEQWDPVLEHGGVLPADLVVKEQFEETSSSPRKRRLPPADSPQQPLLSPAVIPAAAAVESPPRQPPRGGAAADEAAAGGAAPPLPHPRPGVLPARPASTPAGSAAAGTRVAPAPVARRSSLPSRRPATAAGHSVLAGHSAISGKWPQLGMHSATLPAGALRAARSSSASRQGPKPPLPQPPALDAAARPDAADAGRRPAAGDDSDEEPCMVTAREGNLLRLPILEGVMF
eukprot:TRINITY_DN47643_c0_g1_i1.p1 TRINITY_DN47643_c0_g1~~TRINITY_DN47643_c0_g1_i1.p1  ORF type:complete len:988 (+),score=340.38 TRINITY_DN47643_c0_g1_i1:110-3073(+)